MEKMMNLEEQLVFLFGEINPSIELFDGPDGEKFTARSFEDALEVIEGMADPFVSTIMGGKVYAIQNYSLPASAGNITIKSMDSGQLDIFCLENPCDLSQLEEDDLVLLPLEADWYAWNIEDRDFFTLDALDKLIEGELENDIENVDSPLQVEDAVVVSSAEKPTSSGPDEGPSTGDSVEKGDEGISELGESDGSTGVRDENDRDRTTDGTDEEQESVAAPSEPIYVNDAEILGEEHPDMAAMYARPTTFMVGNLYGMKDRKNTQDGEWQETTMPMLNWIVGGEGSTGPWGLSRHPVAKSKEGASIVLVKSLDGARTDAAISEMHAIGLDVDSGAKLEDVVDKLLAKNIFAVVYSSFNHGKSELVLKHDDVVKKLKLTKSPDIAEIRVYLQEHHKDRFEHSFINQVQIEEINRQTSTGNKIILSTPPLDKFRVIIPLMEAVKLSELAPTVSQWKDAWADAVCGVAVNMLDINFDSTSCDVNRLFYTPRHAEGSDDYKAYVVQGRPLRFEDIKPYPKSAFVRDRGDVDAFAQVGTDFDKDTVARAFAPSGMSLNAWHTEAKERFMLADVLEQFCEERLRISGGEKDGAVHVECPFEHEHSEEGGTACMAVNAIDSDSEYWTWFCHHDSCQGRHKLELLEEALKEDWFPESVLTDEDFVLPPEDVIEAETVEDSAQIDCSVSKTPVERSQVFTMESSEADIKEFLIELANENIDTVIRNLVTASLASTTALTKANLAKIWKEVHAEKAEEVKKNSVSNMDDFTGTPSVNNWGFKDLCEYAYDRIEKTNAKKPRMFHYVEEVARITETARGHPRIEILDKPKFAHELNNISKFAHTTITADGERTREVSAPKEVVEHIFSGGHSYCPRLKGVVTSPIFAADGSMLVEPGYNAASSLVYIPNHSMTIPPVSKVPTVEEVEEAKRLLIDEAFADFPVGGYTTSDSLIEASLSPDGVPSMTHLLSFTLMYFCKEMIPGNWPAYLIQKHAPGSGASLLTEVCSIIGTGEKAAPTQMGKDDEEIGKSLLSMFLDGKPLLYFDNINKEIDSAALASCMTSRVYYGRRLGATQHLAVDISSHMMLTGNNVQTSSEIARRIALIMLDPKMANPEERQGFRKPDICEWAEENRGTLVWACLTLVQNYVAKGQQPYKGKVLNSFEDWSRVMGGIMRDAGIGGFLGNTDDLKDMVQNNDGDEIIPLLEVWWAVHGETDVVVSQDGNEEALTSIAMSRNIELDIHKGKNADGDVIYKGRSFGQYLTKNRGRVIRLEDGTEVSIEKGARGAFGYKWGLRKQNGT